jgi:hypothetical protein
MCKIEVLKIKGFGRCLFLRPQPFSDNTLLHLPLTNVCAMSWAKSKVKLDRAGVPFGGSINT